MRKTSTLNKTSHALSWAFSCLLFLVCFITDGFAQNIFSGEPVQWVGRPNGYSTVPYNADYRTTGFRRVSVNSGNPTDGRGQWATTINVQNAGGNIAPDNMPGGPGAGWLLISGPNTNRFLNKWNFNGIGQAGINAVNDITLQGGGQDMGLNMGTTGYYTFVMRDNGYANSQVYIGYTQNAPVTLSNTAQSFDPITYEYDINITTGATPSTGENVYVRYRAGTNNFSTGTSIVQASGSGTAWTASIPQQTCGSTVYYYIFTSTRSLAQLNGDSEQNRSLATLRYADNGGNNFSYSVSPAPVAGITNITEETELTCALTEIEVEATGGGTYSWSNGLGTNAEASITAPGTYTVTVTAENGCTDQESIVITQDITAPTAGITNVSGTTVLTCTQTTITLIPTGGVSQEWTVGASGSGSLVVTSPGLYTATATGANGCTATASVTITQDITPPTAGITNVTGETELTCALTEIQVTGTGGGTYAWDNDLGNFNEAVIIAPGTYTVTVTGANGCTDQESIVITQNTTPPTAGITNNSGTTILTCAVTSISVTATGGSSYSWDGGATPTTAANSFTAPGTYTVLVTGANGCLDTESIIVTQDLAVPGSTTVSGTVNVCPFVGNNTPVTYTASASGATSYNWIIPPNVVIQSGQGTANLTVTFLAGFTAQANKQLRVTASNSCGSSALVIYYLLAQLPNTPQPITGATSACPFIGVGSTTYTIPAVASALTYNWIVPANANILSGQGTTSITVSFNNSYATGAITVNAQNLCGTSGLRSLTVTRNNPSTPSLISGPTNACPFITPNSPAAYSIPPVVSATTYTWTANNGATIVTGQGTTNVSIQYPIAYTGGVVSVTATNGCGTSQPRNLTIGTLNPSTPGVIDVINTVVCPNREYTYTIAAYPANTTNLVWTVPTGQGAVILSGQGTTSITVSYPGTIIDGVVTVQAFSPCGQSVLRSVEVKLPACPGSRTPLFTKGSSNTETMMVNVFPNPTTTDFKMQVIAAGKDRLNVRVLDLQGRIIKQFVVMPYQTVNIGADLQPGTYMIESRQGSVTKVVKVIKL